MTIKIFAKTIPNDIRKQLVSEPDPIATAIAVADNIEMKFLLKIWHDYIEPNKPISTCSICMQNILLNFKQMKPVLMEIEKEYQLLKQV